MSSTKRIRERGTERGQVLALAAILIAVVGGMAALSIDLGSYSAERRDLQNAADAISLAASQDLPSADAVKCQRSIGKAMRRHIATIAKVRPELSLRRCSLVRGQRLAKTGRQPRAPPPARGRHARPASRAIA